MDCSTPGFLSFTIYAFSTHCPLSSQPPLGGLLLLPSPFHSCGRRDLKSFDDGSQVTAGSSRTRNGLALSVLKVLFFPILQALSFRRLSIRLRGVLSLLINQHSPLLPPASLNLPGKVRPSPAVRPWVGPVISWFRTSIRNHF